MYFSGFIFCGEYIPGSVVIKAMYVSCGLWKFQKIAHYIISIDTDSPIVSSIANESSQCIVSKSYFFLVRAFYLLEYPKSIPLVLPTLLLSAKLTPTAFVLLYKVAIVIVFKRPAVPFF